MASARAGWTSRKSPPRRPEKIHKVVVEPMTGLADKDAEDVARKIGITGKSGAAGPRYPERAVPGFRRNRLFSCRDQSLIVTADEKVVALDAKMNFDDNACSGIPTSSRCAISTRKIPLKSRRPSTTETISSWTATSVAWSMARLAMATMDIIKLYAAPRQLFDVAAALRRESDRSLQIMTKNPSLKAILVNIFGGIMKCDVIAKVW